MTEMGGVSSDCVVAVGHGCDKEITTTEIVSYELESVALFWGDGVTNQGTPPYAHAQ